MIFEASLDVGLRLAVGTIAGGVIGLQCARRGKPAGIRTLGLIGLASALAALLGAMPGRALFPVAVATVIGFVVLSQPEEAGH
jgi:putative Mg2+ transporter-C (MgtC) family protein